MRILVDAHVFSGKFQGTRTYIKGLYSSLILRNQKWFFYIASDNSDLIKREFPETNNVIFVNYKYKNSFLRLLFDIPRLISKYEIDYAHFQYITPLFRYCKYIVTTHDILFAQKEYKSFFDKKYRYIKGPLFKHSAKKSDLLFTVSEYSKDKISENYSISKDKIYVTPNSINFIDLEVNNTNDDSSFLFKKKYLLYVSRIEPRKNHVSVLKSFIELELYEKDYYVVFVGTSDHKYPELEKYIYKFKNIFDKYLIFLEGIEDDQLRNIYSNAELKIYPSLAEGFGIPPLEAALLKKKVICSNKTAMRDFSFFKYHVNPLDQQLLNQTIIQALNDSNYPFNCIKNTIIHKYSWSKSAMVFEEAIRQ